jgi:uncharacterized membrane protein YhaH (DUF805 family)
LDWRYLFLSFDGRISRQPFWMAFFLAVGAEFACELLVRPLESGERLAAIVSLAFAYQQFAVCAKRGHDRNIDLRVIGAFFLFSVILDFLTVVGLSGTQEQPSTLLLTLGLPYSLFGVVLLIELGFRRGTHGENRFGADPLA